MIDTAPTWQQQMRKLGEAINRITNDATNYGGCGVVACAVAKELEKLGIRSDIAITTSRFSGNDINQAREEMNNRGNRWETLADWQSLNMDVPHAKARFDKDGRIWVYDTDDGVHVYRSQDYKDGGFTVEEMDKMTQKQAGWNYTFPRKTIPKIQKLVRRYMRHVQLEG